METKKSEDLQIWFTTWSNHFKSMDVGQPVTPPKRDVIWAFEKNLEPMHVPPCMFFGGLLNVWNTLSKQGLVIIKTAGSFGFHISGSKKIRIPQGKNKNINLDNIHFGSFLLVANGWCGGLNHSASTSISLHCQGQVELPLSASAETMQGFFSTNSNRLSGCVLLVCFASL